MGCGRLRHTTPGHPPGPLMLEAGLKQASRHSRWNRLLRIRAAPPCIGCEHHIPDGGRIPCWKSLHTILLLEFIRSHIRRDVLSKKQVSFGSAGSATRLNWSMRPEHFRRSEESRPTRP